MSTVELSTVVPIPDFARRRGDSRKCAETLKLLPSAVLLRTVSEQSCRLAPENLGRPSSVGAEYVPLAAAPV